MPIVDLCVLLSIFLKGQLDQCCVVVLMLAMYRRWYSRL